MLYNFMEWDMLSDIPENKWIMYFNNNSSWFSSCPSVVQILGQTLYIHLPQRRHKLKLPTVL